MEKTTTGIKETLELVQAVKGIALDSIDALKDGIDLDDIKILFKNLDPLKTALEGIDKIDDEFKDLDVEEIKTIINEAVELVFAIIAKIKEIKTPEPTPEV